MTQAEIQYRKLTKLAAIASISVSLFLLTVKLIVWILSGSLILLTSMMDSVFDMLASIVSFFILKHATKPADEDHSFGHGKIEHLGVLTQALFISSSAIVIAVEAVSHIISGNFETKHNSLVIAVAIISIITTFILIQFQKHIIAKTKSSAITADSMHYKMDLYLNLVIIFAVVLSTIGVTYADPIFALVIAVVIVVKAISMLIDAVQSLIDKSMPEHDLEKIYKIINSHPQILGIHNLRTRKAGITNYIEFHLELDDSLSFYQAHTICDDIESALHQIFDPVAVTIHPEPVSVAQIQKAGNYDRNTNKELLDKLLDQVDQKTKD